MASTIGSRVSGICCRRIDVQDANGIPSRTRRSRAATAKSLDLNVIHDELRDRICLRRYTPGTLLRESELAAEFGISRTPIRAVLQRLALLGLVEVRNGVGTEVKAYSDKEIDDIYRLRLQVAMLIGDMAVARIRPAQVSAVGALLDRWESESRQRDIAAYWRINHALHFQIGGLIDNFALRQLWDRLYFQVAAVWYGCTEHDFERLAASLRQELRDVLRAMSENDAAAVGYIQRNYIAAGYRRLRAGGPADGDRGHALSADSAGAPGGGYENQL